MVPLWQGDDGVIRVLLTLRSDTLRHHPREVALPGGKCDEADVDDRATALRETVEEVGIDPKDVTIVTELQPRLSKHLLSVKPVIACLPSDFRVQPNPDEVSEVFHPPLELFLSRHAHSSIDVQWQGYTNRLHHIAYEGYDVWGFTAGVLIEVAQLVYGRPPEFEERPPGSPLWTSLGVEHEGGRVRVLDD